MQHIIFGCQMLTQLDCRARHDNVATIRDELAVKHSVLN